MMVSTAVGAVVQALAARLLLSGGATVWNLAALAAAEAAALAFFEPAASSTLPTIVTAESRQRANGLMAISASSTAVAGPIVAAGIIAVARPAWALAADALTFAVALRSRRNDRRNVGSASLRASHSHLNAAAAFAVRPDPGLGLPEGRR
jgi:MFS family permease